VPMSLWYGSEMMGWTLLQRWLEPTGDCYITLSYAAIWIPDDEPHPVIPPDIPGGPYASPEDPTPSTVPDTLPAPAVPPPSPPPVPAAQACTEPDSVVAPSQIEWGATPSVPFEIDEDHIPQTVVTCSGTSAEACIAGNPGIWVGSLPLKVMGISLAGTHHTAIATNPPMSVSELKATVITTPEEPNIPPTVFWVDSIRAFKPQPAFQQGFASYRWVRVADGSKKAAVDSAVTRATGEFEGNLYLASSNRFISNVLRYAGLTLTAEQRTVLGSSPGICWCGGSCSN